MALGSIGVISALGFYSVSHYLTGVRNHKLKKDVTTVNAAIQAYKLNGGDLSGVNSGEAAIAKMKTQVDALQADQVVGFTGAVVDPRLSLTVVPASPNRKRAVWDSAGKRFVVISGGTQAGYEFHRSRTSERDYSGRSKSSCKICNNRQLGLGLH